MTRSSAIAERRRALCVIEYFAKSLKVIRNDSFRMTLSDLNDTVEKGVCKSLTTSIPLKLCLYSEIFSIKEWRDLEISGRGLSRSLKMAPFDILYTTFYWSAIVNMVLSCTVFELFDVE